EADRICAVGVADGFEFCSGSLRSFFPRDGKQLIALANERLLDALGMLREVEAEAAFDAEEVAVDTAHVAIIGSNNFVIADAERGFAAVRTMRANCRDVFHFPRPCFVTIGAAGERTDGANVNAHAALFALEMIFTIGNDYRICAAHADAEG